MTTKAAILVVDNDPEDCAFIQYAFSQINQSCPLQFLSSGHELLDLLVMLEPDELPELIVLDYNMPELSGLETLEQLKDNPFIAHLPVLVYSTAVTPDMKRSLADMNVLACIEKSKSREKLLEQARYFLELVEGC